MDRRRILASSLLVASLCCLAACVPAATPEIEVEPLARPVSFLEDVKPLLDRRCTVCHSCYNAACQLKLSSYEGADRGGSKEAVYSSSRLEPQTPSRLFLDASSTAEWRKRGFFSVTESRAQPPFNDSIMLQFLEAKRKKPVAAGRYEAESEAKVCPADALEAQAFIGAHPERGMPYGFPALEPNEHTILATWLLQGAAGPNDIEQNRLVIPTAEDQLQIQKWEAFLNREDPKHAMTARYLFEHFFLAHVRFPATDSGEFFEIVRSTTAPEMIGTPIDPIATVRPYDDPGVEKFYYRFRKIHSTIVQKTHMVVDFSDETLARFQALFIEPEWLGTPRVMPYDEELGANPFIIFAQIPPDSRYRFLLDHSEYFILTFMRGPVCRGQVALNVIHDQFWVLFLDPDSDLTVAHPEFLIEQANNLRLPDERGSDQKLLKALGDQYRDRYSAFFKAKTELYQELVPEGLGLDSIWPGRVPEDSPMLTAYRHFDSASLHRGALGDLPRTAWVIDYSQFERIYYALVAGFDVFGNVAHQVSVRRYMDYLRMEGELNFVTYLPPEDRVAIFQSWYLGEGALEDTQAQETLTLRATAVRFQTDEPKREFIERVVKERLPESAKITFDPINYQKSERQTPMPTTFSSHEDILDGFRALTAPGTGFIRHVNGSAMNVMFVRIRGYRGEDRFFSIVVNRWHDNVSSLFFEKKRLDPARDTIDFLPGAIGEYPNYFMDVSAESIPDFFDMLENFDGSPEYLAKLEKYGVNRTDPEFWDVYDWFQAQAISANPIRAGLFDLNRYHPTAFE